MKCNHCKNPVKEQDVICEWCGREISLFQSNDTMHPVNKFEQELREIESKAREKFQERIDNINSNSNEGIVGKIFGTTNYEQWDEDYEEELSQYVYKLHAKAVANFVLPTNPKLLKEVLELAKNNYRLNKVAFWDDDEENKNKLLLSLAWLNLSKVVKNKLGIENRYSAVDKLVNYLYKNSGLKWVIIVFSIYVLFFVIIGLINYFQE
ncbi:hypothetical protein OAI37_05425 [Flavobacteriaceae bacterium]|nr:hypothetical protein [Flavobacteriaceae bacterium]